MHPGAQPAAAAAGSLAFVRIPGRQDGREREVELALRQAHDAVELGGGKPQPVRQRPSRLGENPAVRGGQPLLHGARRYAVHTRDRLRGRPFQVMQQAQNVRVARRERADGRAERLGQLRAVVRAQERQLGVCRQRNLRRYFPLRGVLTMSPDTCKGSSRLLIYKGTRTSLNVLEVVLSA